MRSSLEMPSVIPDKPESESGQSPEIGRTVDYIEELLTPRRGDALRALIKTELYKGAEENDERRVAVEKVGFDPKGLEELGAKLWEKLHHSQAKTDVEKIQYEHLGLGPIQLIASEKNGKPLYHTDLTIGAAEELTRLMRKMLAASIADDPDTAEDILYAPNAVIRREQIQEFVELMNNDHESLVERQRDLVRAIPPDEEVERGSKRRQYAFAARHLTRYTLDRLGKRPLSKG